MSPASPRSWRVRGWWVLPALGKLAGEAGSPGWRDLDNDINDFQAKELSFT